jgi:hypothetical protein
MMEDPDTGMVSHSDEGSPDREQDAMDNEETLRVEGSPGGGDKEEGDENSDRGTAQDKGGTTADADEDVKLSLGGLIESLAFCLLDGIFEDPKEGTKKRVTVPINRVPAVLGRTHNTSDRGFFGLGKVKALSREQCRIDYRTPINVGGGSGQLEQDDPKKESFTLKRNSDNKSSELSNPKKLDLSNKSGFFVISCLGKNRITVNGERVEQGQTAVLPTGSTIRISHYSLYFFLPTKVSTKTMQIPDPSSKTSAPTAAGGSKKRKSLASTATPSMATSGSGSGPSKKSKMAAGGWPTLQAELDSMTVDALLTHLEAGMDTENWDRRQQLVGSTLSYRAVLAAARSKIIQASAKANGGASRSEIMNWIEKSDKFGRWRALMLTKLEIKSYQASITKALIRAEFERTGTSGRYIKWLLPKSILKEIKDRKDKKKKGEKGSGDDEDSKQQDATSSDKKEGSEEESGDEEDSKKGDATSQKKQESEEDESGDDDDSKKQDATTHKKQESEEESDDDEDSKKQNATSQKKQESDDDEDDDEGSKKEDTSTSQKKQESDDESGDDEESKKQDSTSQKMQEQSEESDEEDNDQDELSRGEPTGMNASKDAEGDNDDGSD